MRKEVGIDTLKSLGYPDLLREASSRVEPVWNLPVQEILNIFPDNQGLFSQLAKNIQGDFPTAQAEKLGVDVPQPLRSTSPLDVQLNPDKVNTEWIEWKSSQMGSIKQSASGRSTPLMMDLEFERKVWLAADGNVDQYQRLWGSGIHDIDIWDASYGSSGSTSSVGEFSLAVDANTQVGATLLSLVGGVIKQLDGRLGGFGEWIGRFNSSLVAKPSELDWKPDLRLIIKAQENKEGKGILRIDLPTQNPVGSHVARSIAELTWLVRPDLVPDKNGVVLLRMDKPYTDLTINGNKKLWEYINEVVVNRHKGEIEFANGDNLDKLLSGNAWAYVWRG